MSDELKPCPFCGSSHIRNIENGMGQNLTGCNSCGSRITYQIEDLELAAKVWNTRPVEDALRAENERLREALERFANIDLTLPVNLAIAYDILHARAALEVK